MKLLRFIWVRLRGGDKQIRRYTLYLVCWVVFIVGFFRIHEPTIPPFDQLKIAEGKAQFTHRTHHMTRGSRIVINGQEFGCGQLWFGSGACGFDEQERRLWAGRPARVWWYEQKTHLGYSYPTSAQIEIAGKIVQTGLYPMTYENNLSLEWEGYRFSFVMHLVLIGFLLLFFLGRYIRQCLAVYRQSNINEGEAHHVE